MRTSKTKKNIFSKNIDEFFEDVHRGYLFTLQFFKEVFTPPFHWREVINQCYEIGIKTLPLITVTGFIIGLVFTKQSRPSLEEFGATSWLPSLIGIAIVKALGPLVTALICAGKVGSGMGAELGSMRVTEQIDAMEVSAINPFKYLVVTRMVSTTVIIPVLTFYCSFVAMMGSYANVNSEEATSFVSFFKNAFSTIKFLDLYTSIAKSILFGFTIGVMGCYQGFYATQGTRGVGKAANRTVVFSMFLIFLEELIVVQVANWLRFF